MKSNLLRILATLEAKTAKISNFWTFWPIIKLRHRITVQNVQKLLILAVLASSVASILKGCGPPKSVYPYIF